MPHSKGISTMQHIAHPKTRIKRDFVRGTTHLKISTYLSSKQFGVYPLASIKTSTQLNQSRA
jgi:hypothetical protein